MNLYQNRYNDSRANAQDNLCGRTHYVDDGTLRFHKSRIISAHVLYEGLLFGIVESYSADYNNTRRAFRGVIFDLFGTALYRPELADGFSTSKAATKAFWKMVNAINAQLVTREAITRALLQHGEEMNQLLRQVNEISQKAA